MDCFILVKIRAKFSRAFDRNVLIFISHKNTLGWSLRRRKNCIIYRHVVSKYWSHFMDASLPKNLYVLRIFVLFGDIVPVRPLDGSSFLPLLHFTRHVGWLNARIFFKILILSSLSCTSSCMFIIPCYLRLLSNSLYIWFLHLFLYVMMYFLSRPRVSLA